MNPQNTSFIPKRPTQGKIQNRGVRKIYILSYVSYILFFGALTSAVAVFLYTYTLQAKVNIERTKLTQEQSKFSQGEIESVLRLEQLINTAEKKMDAHISLPRIFAAIESSAVDTLVLNEFNYKRVDDAAPVLTIKGESSKFNSVLFQREVLALNPILAKSTFSKIEITGETGNDQESEGQDKAQGAPSIKFEISSDIDPALVKYTPAGVASLTSNNASTTETTDTASEQADQTNSTQSNDDTSVTSDSQ